MQGVLEIGTNDFVRKTLAAHLGCAQDAIGFQAEVRPAPGEPAGVP